MPALDESSTLESEKKPAAVLLGNEKSNKEDPESSTRTTVQDCTNLGFFSPVKKVHTSYKKSALHLVRSYLRGNRKKLPFDSAMLPAFVCENDDALTTLSFPERLMLLLTYVEKSDKYSQHHLPPISWMENGRAFMIRDKDAVANELLDLFFGPCKFSSFVSTLHRWKFQQWSSSLCDMVFGKEFMKTHTLLVFGNANFQRNHRSLMSNMTSNTMAHNSQDSHTASNASPSEKDVDYTQTKSASSDTSQLLECWDEKEIPSAECPPSPATKTLKRSDPPERDEKEIPSTKCPPSPATEMLKQSDGEPARRAKKPKHKSSNDKVQMGKTHRGSASHSAVLLLPRGTIDILPKDNSVNNMLDMKDIPSDVDLSALNFPQRLMLMMSYIEEMNDPDPPISWILDGTAFVIQNSDALIEKYTVLFFGPFTFDNFKRRLYRWGFKAPQGLDWGEMAWANEHFQRDNKRLLSYMECEAGYEKEEAIENAVVGTFRPGDNRQSAGEVSDSGHPHPRDPGYPDVLEFDDCQNNANLTMAARERAKAAIEQREYGTNVVVPKRRAIHAELAQMADDYKRRAAMAYNDPLPRRRRVSRPAPLGGHVAISGPTLPQNQLHERQFLGQAAQHNPLSTTHAQLQSNHVLLLRQPNTGYEYATVPAYSPLELQRLQYRQQLQELQGIHDLQVMKELEGLQQQQSRVIEQIRMQERKKVLTELSMAEGQMAQVTHGPVPTDTSSSSVQFHPAFAYWHLNGSHH